MAAGAQRLCAGCRPGSACGVDACPLPCPCPLVGVSDSPPPTLTPPQAPRPRSCTCSACGWRRRWRATRPPCPPSLAPARGATSTRHGATRARAPGCARTPWTTCWTLCRWGSSSRRSTSPPPTSGCSTWRTRWTTRTTSSRTCPVRACLPASQPACLGAGMGGQASQGGRQRDGRTLQHLQPAGLTRCPRPHLFSSPRSRRVRAQGQGRGGGEAGGGQGGVRCCGQGRRGGGGRRHGCPAQRVSAPLVGHHPQRPCLGPKRMPACPIGRGAQRRLPHEFCSA